MNGTGHHHDIDNRTCSARACTSSKSSCSVSTGAFPVVLHSLIFTYLPLFDFINMSHVNTYWQRLSRLSSSRLPSWQLLDLDMCQGRDIQGRQRMAMYCQMITGKWQA
jgi:hypothetical protein